LKESQTKIIAFTICSNNYLAQAKVLAESFLRYNPSHEFVIGLCDRMNNQVNYLKLNHSEIIEVEKLEIEGFNKMVLDYNIVELNTAVKPFFFEYLFKKSEAESIIYFDPDICIYDSIDSISKEMENHNVLLTPHIITPIPLDGLIPNEGNFLNFGIYNLGFLCLKRSYVVIKMLQWWKERMKINCFARVAEGIFVDQLPMNLVPIFFPEVKICLNPGYNMAWWNLHERTLSKNANGDYFVNGINPLMFFHFSSYDPCNKGIISLSQTRYKMDKVPFIAELFSEYDKQLTENNFSELKKIPCYFAEIRSDFLKQMHIKQIKAEPSKIKLIRFIKKNIPQRINYYIKRYNNL
jgi:hypothetical protein